MSKERFVEKLERIINEESMENGSNSPDYLLADYLIHCLDNFDRIVSLREKWYGRGSRQASTEIEE